MIWVFPKRVGFSPPNHRISIGFSMIFTIHFGFFPPISGFPPIWLESKIIHRQSTNALLMETFQSDLDRGSELTVQLWEQESPGFGVVFLLIYIFNRKCLFKSLIFHR